MSKKVVLMTDVHGLLEPLEKCLTEIKKENVEAICCLGDAIGDGPSPEKVLSLLRENNLEHPLFHGNSLFSYDAIFGGHTHFEIPCETYQNTDFYTLRSLSMGVSKR